MRKIKVYGVDRLIKPDSEKSKKGEQWRSMDDYELDFSKLIDIANSDKVHAVNYYTEIDSIEKAFKDNPKFKKLSL
jgi:CRISPR-associated protein Csh2